MNASHAKQPAASSPVLPPALSPSSTDSNPSPSTAPLQPPVETHARIRSRLRARTRVHVSPFTLRVFLLRGAREEGRGSKRRRDGVRGDKSSGLFHKCATHHVHGFALSLSLSLSFAIYLSSSHRNMGRLYNACYEHLWRLHVSIA